jgi:hypothetical protein
MSVVVGVYQLGASVQLAGVSTSLVMGILVDEEPSY